MEETALSSSSAPCSDCCQAPDVLHGLQHRHGMCASAECLSHALLHSLLSHAAHACTFTCQRMHGVSACALHRMLW